MKKILLTLMMVDLLLPLAPRAQAENEVSLNFFYDNLTPYGSWIEVGDYGYCFQPNVAVDSSDWRPYSDGYWAYTDVGWTWVSYEDFGWATYHYGRWTNLDNYGWVWVPGYDWGPAWVSWRTGGDYVGWAPLPPAGGVVYEGRAITGGVDVEFGIGPLSYNFVDLRYIGEPILRRRLLAPSRNVTIINQTVNVTNITYVNATVYNYGPDYNRLNQYSTRPIERLTLQREPSVEANFAQVGKGKSLNRKNGNQLVVVAPPIQRSTQSIVPKKIKAKVQQPKIEKGWQGIQNRQQVEAEMKKQDRKDISGPSFQPQKGRKRENVAGADQTSSRETRAATDPNRRAPPPEGQSAVQQPMGSTQDTRNELANRDHRQERRAQAVDQNDQVSQRAARPPHAEKTDNSDRAEQPAQRPGRVTRDLKQQARPAQSQQRRSDSQQSDQTPTQRKSKKEQREDEQPPRP